MPVESFFDDWLAALGEAAGVAGAPSLDRATAPQLERAWQLLAETAGVSPGEIATKLAEEAGLSVAGMSTGEPLAAHLVPAAVAYRRLVMPLRCDDRDLVLATANPAGQATKRELVTLTGRAVRFEVATPGQIDRAIRAWYGPARQEQVESWPPEQLNPDGPHVLVVDDEPSARALFRSLLRDAGFRVTIARDGPEAVSLAAGEHDFDLVTLDYWMNEMNGLRVLQKLRAGTASAHLPVIVVTGVEDRSIQMSLFEAGADDFITKPIDAPLFLLRVNAVLRRRQLA